MKSLAHCRMWQMTHRKTILSQNSLFLAFSESPHQTDKWQLYSAYRSLPGHGCEIRPPRCRSDPHTSTGRCCCDTGGTCSSPPHHRRANTDLQGKRNRRKQHIRTQCLCVSVTKCVWEEKESPWCVCVRVSVSPSNFFPACFLLMLDSSALQGESERERQGTLVTEGLKAENCRSLLFWGRNCLCELCWLCLFFFLLWSWCLSFRCLGSYRQQQLWRLVHSLSLHLTNLFWAMSSHIGC